MTVERENAGVHDRCAAVKPSSLLTRLALPKVALARTLEHVHKHTHARDTAEGITVSFQAPGDPSKVRFQ